MTLNVVAAETWSLGERPSGPMAPALFGQGNSVLSSEMDGEGKSCVDMK